MSKKGAPWTPEEETDLLEGLKKGHSFETLSRIHQRTVKAVQWRFGLYCKKLMRQGKTIEQIANEFGLDHDFLQRIIEEFVPENKPNTLQIDKKCICKEELQKIKEKVEKQTRILKKLLEKQEKIWSILKK